MSFLSSPARVPYAALAVILPALLSACGAPTEEAATHPEAGVVVARVEARDFADAVVAYGAAEGSPDQGRAVTVEVESRLAEVYVWQGEAVRKGQPIVRLQPSVTTALEAARAQRDARAAEVELQRLTRLRVQRLATESELQTARAAADTLAALRDSLVTRTGQGHGLRIDAPTTGVVDGLTVRPGEVLAAGSVLARILEPTSTIIRLGIEPDALAEVRADASVELADLQGASVGDGRVRSIDRRIDPQSGLASLLVQVESALGVPSGTRVRARIIRAVHSRVPGVPRSAVLIDGQQAHVFVAENAKASRREVQLGFRDQEQIEITAGIALGEQVVVLGNDELTDGMAVRVEQSAPQGSEP